jgi:hypothetical protein
VAKGDKFEERTSTNFLAFRGGGEIGWGREIAEMRWGDNETATGSITWKKSKHKKAEERMKAKELDAMVTPSLSSLVEKLIDGREREKYGTLIHRSRKNGC